MDFIIWINSNSYVINDMIQVIKFSNLNLLYILIIIIKILNHLDCFFFLPSEIVWLGQAYKAIKDEDVIIKKKKYNFGRRTNNLHVQKCYKFSKKFQWNKKKLQMAMIPKESLTCVRKRFFYFFDFFSCDRRKRLVEFQYTEKK
jgi:hypothetical protein